MRRTMLVTGALLVLTAACTTEESSDPGPTLTSTTSTTEVPVETTEAPVETTVAPTTDESTTTTTEPPTEPVTGAVPLLTGGAEGGWLSLGGWSGTAWAGPTDGSGAPIAPSIAAGTAMTLSNLDGDQAATTGDNVEACYDERVGPTMSVAITSPDPPGFGYGAVAVGATDRPLLPRPVAVTATGPDTYRALGQAIFAGDPVDAAGGSVVQVVVGDLDGDDDDEAIVVFEFVQPSAGPGAPGDLSALYIVDAASRTPSTVRAMHVPTDLPAEVTPLVERNRVIDVADYNGDGRMEVAVHAWYFEGASVIVYEYDGTSLREVLVAGCGA